MSRGFVVDCARAISRQMINLALTSQADNAPAIVGTTRNSHTCANALPSAAPAR